MKKIRVKQVRSGIGHPEIQKKTLKALGLGRIGRMREHNATPQIMGMVEKVAHLISVEEI
ncbi:MAG: large subunit ribosomal protein [Bacteroidales bacterium]|jgi:large subunit ribosomal protein L30|nr:large subunit ribosomal protein [Bacteroidales bacterium]MDN5330368.1 large subunit ribosomal protein [Bacteroidales bacterium]NLH52562.1 50S ribosomal protein L30 [Bacteroidales bacterium]NPV36709.1 50S ribosomal protein L30 [Bacteroidales bacterium]